MTDKTCRPDSFSVAALYQFTSFDDLQAVQAPLAELCERNGVKGTLLIAREGINGTMPDRKRRSIPFLRTFAHCPAARLSR